MYSTITTAMQQEVDIYCVLELDMQLLAPKGICDSQAAGVRGDDGSGVGCRVWGFGIRVWGRRRWR